MIDVEIYNCLGFALHGKDLPDLTNYITWEREREIRVDWNELIFLFKLIRVLHGYQSLHHNSNHAPPCLPFYVYVNLIYIIPHLIRSNFKIFLFNKIIYFIHLGLARLMNISLTIYIAKCILHDILISWSHMNNFTIHVSIDREFFF